ncbi:heparan-alpha-glucosaminide N-acetyltransferase [Galendromus occidentalis]|uniref:Heparan-alpha-glucosaminide N-acetyltransferase n=1 Tax=Galendromus occidentalis TaxID=34638 RepID=A0AAJ7WIM0_9ACAR|nr:heparan-alpha-glucosaminide N-acetyltransferase [Galendromus occidentalis]
MIFVNYGGGGLWLFEHIPWDGLTFADLLFPWFVWIMGVSMAISLRSMRRKCVPLSEIFFKILSRSVKLFLLGLILNSMGKNNDISKLRIPGVLQRFAVSYFVVASMHMFFSRATDAAETAKWAKIRDVALYWQEWVMMISLVAIHVLLTFLLDVPDCPKGYLGPGGLHENGTHFNCTGGAAGYIDRVVLGPNHMYGHPTTEKIYETSQPFDPEGVLGCLTSIFLTFLGLQAGKILLTFNNPGRRLSRWICWGVLLGLLAGILCGFSKEDGWIPINKNLWSLSYVLCTAGLAFLLLSVFYLIIDVLALWSAVPFIYPGMNSILVYVGHALVTDMLPWFWAGPETHWRYMAMNLGGAYIWVLIAYVLHENRVYLAL